MPTKMTVVVDNIANQNIKGEWGLCIHIEHNGKNILLDTGSSTLFAENLKKLGLNIQEIDYAVLSHAHYDHSNGMAYFFNSNQKANFYLQKDANENCYFKKLFFHSYIGLPKNILTDFLGRITKVSGKYELFSGAYLLSHNSPNLDKIGKREMMYVKNAKSWLPDNFSHEQSLVLETEKGLLIFNSCCHGGVDNILTEVANAFPEQKIFGLIGGFHLFNKSKKEIISVANQIKQSGIEYVCTGHCTKNRAYKILKTELGDTLHQLHVGLIVESL